MFIKNEYVFNLAHTLIFSILSYYLYFFQFPTPSQNVEFRINRSHLKIWLFEESNFVQDKWVRSHTSCLHAKWLICFRMWWQTFSQTIWVVGRDVPLNHKNKVLRSKEKGLLSFQAPNKYCMSGKLNHTYLRTYLPTYLPSYLLTYIHI